MLQLQESASARYLVVTPGRMLYWAQRLVAVATMAVAATATTTVAREGQVQRRGARSSRGFPYASASRGTARRWARAPSRQQAGADLDPILCQK
jgi:hypothetical protein